MTLYWEPDTCECRINLTEMVFCNRCKIHLTVNEVFAHNRSFNLSGKDFERISKDKEFELNRIRSL